MGAVTVDETPALVRVLLVDDEPDIRFMLRLHLDKDVRFEVAGEASDGQEALDCCAALAPDLIVLDVRMPRLDGMAALPRLRSACPRARIAMFTAFAETVDSELVRSHDAVLFEKGDPLPWLADRLFEFATHEHN
jgi:DNA-binding NarL/FixJ family response regulator